MIRNRIKESLKNIRETFREVWPVMITATLFTGLSLLIAGSNVMKGYSTPQELMDDGLYWIVASLIICILAGVENKTKSDEDE